MTHFPRGFTDASVANSGCEQSTCPENQTSLKDALRYFRDEKPLHEDVASWAGFPQGVLKSLKLLQSLGNLDVAKNKKTISNTCLQKKGKNQRTLS